MKLQLRTIEDITKNGKININNNINNININFKNKNQINSEGNITPKNYEIIKQYQLSPELKWYLFKKKSSKILYSSDINSSFSEYIWIPAKNEQEFKDFDNFSKYEKKEKEFNENYLIEKINRLKNENINLNRMIATYSNNSNYIGLSFIEENDNINDMEDKCLEDILDELDKNDNGINRKNNRRDKIYYNTTNKFYKKEEISFQNLKCSIDSLMAQIDYSQSAKGMLANILKQFGCSEEDIYKLLGNYRGVISIPFKNFNSKNK